MMRNHDPMKEIYHWYFIFQLLGGEIIIACFVLSPQINNLSLLNGSSWGLFFFISLLLFFLLCMILLFSYVFLRYRREKRERNALRQDALQGNHQALITTLPLSFSKLSLPVRIESQAETFFTKPVIIMILGFIVFMMIDYMMILGNLWHIPSFLLWLPSIFSEFVPVWLAGGIMWMLMKQIGGHYLLPSLRVDHDGITAYYGRKPVSMRWENVCYFALVNSPAFGALLREAYELSDGKNIICWPYSRPFTLRRLLRVGDGKLSTQDYASFTYQLASVIVEKTGRPLYDLRLSNHKKKKDVQSQIASLPGS